MFRFEMALYCISHEWKSNGIHIPKEIRNYTKSESYQRLRLWLAKQVSNITRFSPFENESRGDWCSQKSQNLRMWRCKVDSERSKMMSFESSGSCLHTGPSHKYSFVLTKQAARASSCVCVTQILLINPLAHEPPSAPSHKEKRRPHAHYVSTHLAFQLLYSHTFLPPPSACALSLPLFLLPSSSPLYVEQEDANRVRARVLLVFCPIQDQAWHDEGSQKPGTG